MATTTADLYSATTVNSLVVEPLFLESVALRTLTPLRTTSTTVSIPTVDLANAAFVAELSPITDADVSAEMIEITPKKVGSLQVVSRESARDAAAAPIIGKALVAGLADAVDRAWFLGNAGAASPAGLNGFDHQDVNADPSTATDLDFVAEGIALVEDAGGMANVIYVSPAAWQNLSTVKTTDDSNQPLLHQPGLMGDATTRSLYGLRVEVSRHCPDDEAWIVDSTRVLAIVREPFELQTSEHAQFANDGVAVRATGRFEFATPHPDVVVRVGGS